MKRRVLIGLVMFASLLVPAPVLAGTQGASCGTDNEYLNAHENVIGDSSDGDDRIYRCGTGDPDLKQVMHTLPGRCKGDGPKLDDEWNVCISAFYAAIPPGRKLCFYAGAGYLGKIQCYSESFTRRVLNIPAVGNDETQSWRFENNP